MIYKNKNVKNIDRDYLSLSERWIIFIILFFLLSELIGGVSRYYLSIFGFTPLIYVPKMLVLLTLFAVVMNSIWRGKISKIFLGTLFLLCFFAGVGLYYAEGNRLLQVAFGVYALVPFLLGIVALPSFVHASSKLKPYMMVLWGVAVMGVLLNFYFSFPWEGSEYEFSGINIEVSRRWTTLGIKRIAGFSRASFAVAIQILLLSIFLITMLRNGWIRIFIWLMTGITITLTTSKIVVVVYLALTLFMIFRSLLPQTFWRLLIALIAFIGIALPLSSIIISYQFVLSDFTLEFLFLSLDERFMIVWPRGFDLVANHGSILLGRGMGGIGVAQLYFEPFLFHPGDNLYLYLYTLFGFGMFPLIGAYVFRAGYLDSHGSGLELLFFMVVLSVLLEGWTSNLIESPFLAIFFGLSLRYVFLKRRFLNE